MLRMTPLMAFVLVLLPSAGSGQTSASPRVWTVAGREVLRIRVTVGDLTPDKRVDLYDGRLTEILSNVERPIGVADITMRQAGKAIALLVCDELLVTVLPEDAAANKTTVEKLARIWLSNLRKSVPLLSPRVNPQGA